MVQCPTSHAATCPIYSSAWQFKVFLQVLTVIMQKESHMTFHRPALSLEAQNKRGMGDKNPKPSCSHGIQELDKEIILLHMSIFPFLRLMTRKAWCVDRSDSWRI